MDFDRAFARQLDALKEERYYRTFAKMERRCGTFPRAMNHDADGGREVTVWCSNDYLGMGHHPDVVGAMCDTAATSGAGAGGSSQSADGAGRADTASSTSQDRFGESRL